MVAQTRQALTRPIVRYRCHPVHRCRRADRCVEEVDLGCITVSIRAAKVEIPEEDTRQPIDALASVVPAEPQPGGRMMLRMPIKRIWTAIVGLMLATAAGGAQQPALAARDPVPAGPAG